MKGERFRKEGSVETIISGHSVDSSHSHCHLGKRMGFCTEIPHQVFVCFRRHGDYLSSFYQIICRALMRRMPSLAID